MALDGCGLVCKYVLFVFNLIFAIIGFVLLGLGLWLRFGNNTRGIFGIEFLNSSAFVLGVSVLIALGAVMLIVVAFGDYGACNEKRCALQVFSALLSILALAEIVVGVLAYSQRDEVGQFFVEFYTSMYTLYVSNGDPAMGVTLTFVHNSLHCCGVTGISAIEAVKKTCPNPDGFLEHIAMPSCPGVIGSVFDRKAPLVMGVFLGTGALLLTALVCSSVLSKALRQSSSSPQYIILTHSTPSALHTLPGQHDLVSTSPHLDQDPVVFTPLTAANIPMAQA